MQVKTEVASGLQGWVFGSSICLALLMVGIKENRSKEKSSNSPPALVCIQPNEKVNLNKDI